jgi:hypothetical protein
MSDPTYITAQWAAILCAYYHQAKLLNPKHPIMAHPILVIAGFLTTIKSMWDLSRMAREKWATKTLKTEAKSIYVLLRRAYHEGLLLEREYDSLFERLMRAEAHNNSMYGYRTSEVTPLAHLVTALRKVSAEFQAILARKSGRQARRQGQRRRNMSN